MSGEFEIIRDYFQRGQSDPSLLLGIGDDAAVLQPRSGHELCVATDTLISGRHFPVDLAAEDIGWRALAVNLSDLAAMGAQPRFAFLNLSIEKIAPDWLQAFADGFFAALAESATVLAGGDTTRGSLSITVTVIGETPAGCAITRHGAQPGDLICVSGTPGDAAAGLELIQAGAKPANELVRRFRRPEPRLSLGIGLRGIATAMIDVSDGLLADLGHVLQASSVGAQVETAKLPVSAALLEYANRPEDYALVGGDDYELCFTVAPERLPEAQQAAAACNCRIAVIGRITAECDVKVMDGNGGAWKSERRGWEHFTSEPEA